RQRISRKEVKEFIGRQRMAEDLVIEESPYNMAVQLGRGHEIIYSFFTPLQILGVLTSISYIFAVLMNTVWMKQILSSARARKVYLALTVLMVLFFVCNNMLIPWYVNRGAIITVPPVVGLQFE